VLSVARGFRKSYRLLVEAALAGRWADGDTFGANSFLQGLYEAAGADLRVNRRVADSAAESWIIRLGVNFQGSRGFATIDQRLINGKRRSCDLRFFVIREPIGVLTGERVAVLADYEQNHEQGGY
jgi:hypothetical protein